MKLNIPFAAPLIAIGSEAQTIDFAAQGLRLALSVDRNWGIRV